MNREVGMKIEAPYRDGYHIIDDLIVTEGYRLPLPVNQFLEILQIKLHIMINVSPRKTTHA